MMRPFHIKSAAAARPQPKIFNHFVPSQPHVKSKTVSCFFEESLEITLEQLMRFLQFASRLNFQTGHEPSSSTAQMLYNAHNRTSYFSLLLLTNCHAKSV